MAGVSSPSSTASAGYNSGQGIQTTDLQYRSYRIGVDGSVGMAQTTLGDWGYAGISTATTTTVKSGVGQLGTIQVLGGTLGAITVYDNTAASGTVIVPTFTPATAAWGANALVFNCAFSTGLTVVTGAATALTVLYR